MNTFNKSFYTTDFDQEMMDFIEGVHGFSDIQWDSDGDELVCGLSNGHFWTNTFPKNSSIITSFEPTVGLTKQQFKKKIGMTIVAPATEETTFGKKDLVDGMFVKFSDSRLGIKLNSKILSLDLYIELDRYDEELICENNLEELDIVEVFTPCNEHEWDITLVTALQDQRGLKSIWKRTPPKSEKVIKLEKLIAMHEEQLEATKELLAEELSL